MSYWGRRDRWYHQCQRQPAATRRHNCVPRRTLQHWTRLGCGCAVGL